MSVEQAQSAMFPGATFAPEFRTLTPAQVSAIEKTALKLTRDIQNISGATLSSKHVTDGVRRLVTTYAVLLSGQSAQ
jgi:hypothetical protein